MRYHNQTAVSQHRRVLFDIEKHDATQCVQLPGKQREQQQLPHSCINGRLFLRIPLTARVDNVMQKHIVQLFTRKSFQFI